MNNFQESQKRRLLDGLMKKENFLAKKLSERKAIYRQAEESYQQVKRRSEELDQTLVELELDSNEEFGSGFRSNRRAFLGPHEPQPDPITIGSNSTASLKDTGLENFFADSWSGDQNDPPKKLSDTSVTLFLNSEETTSEDFSAIPFENLTTLTPGDDITGAQTAAQVRDNNGM